MRKGVAGVYCGVHVIGRRIVNGESDIRVCEVVSDAVRQRMAPEIARVFGHMRIEWLNNRSWGLSFAWGDDVVRVGHKRGHHIAQMPAAHGISAAIADEIVRLEVEGTLLHELGHALLDMHGLHMLALAQTCYDREGPCTTYEGQTPASASIQDRLHECFAEAVRWHLMGAAFKGAYPMWDAVAAYVVTTLPQVRFAERAW